MFNNIAYHFTDTFYQLAALCEGVEVDCSVPSTKLSKAELIPILKPHLPYMHDIEKKDEGFLRRTYNFFIENGVLSCQPSASSSTNTSASSSATTPLKESQPYSQMPSSASSAVSSSSSAQYPNRTTCNKEELIRRLQPYYQGTDLTSYTAEALFATYEKYVKPIDEANGNPVCTEPPKEKSLKNDVKKWAAENAKGLAKWVYHQSILGGVTERNPSSSKWKECDEKYK